MSEPKIAICVSCIKVQELPLAEFLQDLIDLRICLAVLAGDKNYSAFNQTGISGVNELGRISTGILEIIRKISSARNEKLYCSQEQLASLPVQERRKATR